MKNCVACGGELTSDAEACPICNHICSPTTNDLQADPILTTKWSGPLPPDFLPFTQLSVDVFGSQEGSANRSAKIEQLFGNKTRLLIGRTPDCDVMLPHPSVSRAHAVLEKTVEGMSIRDLSSVNGVMVGGQRIRDRVSLRENERVGIGPYLFFIVGDEIHALDSSRSLRLEARSLEKTIITKSGQSRQLLNNIRLVIEPGEFVALLGPSGSGKSTLMDCLNGRRPATGGQLLANGENFYRHFNSFRKLLGYVPQRDIVHSYLTVYEALYYTARLRLPEDTEPAELAERIDEVLRLMELSPQSETLVANLSGGQIKRVSLGAELISKPRVLYIDEATSGLDAGTETRVMQLFRKLTVDGTSVVCITHNIDNVFLCDLILILVAGRMAYYGPPEESLHYFGVKRLGEVYDRLGEKKPEEWQSLFEASPFFHTYVATRLKPEDVTHAGNIAPPTHPEPAQSAGVATQDRPRGNFYHQTRVLISRYIRLLLTERQSLKAWLLQSPMVGIILLMAFMNAAFTEIIPTMRKLSSEEHTILETAVQNTGEPDTLPIPAKTQEDIHKQLNAILKADVMPGDSMVNPRSTYQLLLLLVITSLWLGCNNSSKEFVKEEGIYARERAVNLGVWPYVVSKFFVLAIITTIQTALFLVVVYGGLALSSQFRGKTMPPGIYQLDVLSLFGVLNLVGLTGVALGLLLSACVSSADKANALLPYLLIPQILLAGGIMPIHTQPLETIAQLISPAYWGWRAIRLGETTLPSNFPYAVQYNDSVALACLALAGQLFFALGLAAWFLKRKDPQRHGK